MPDKGGWTLEGGVKGLAKRSLIFCLTPLQRYLSGPILFRANRSKTVRNLELGPGPKRIAGFETFNIVGGRNVDYVGDVARPLPFPPGTFDLIYASHVLEHVPWYLAQNAVSYWAHALKPGGRLEIWVPDGLKIAQAFVAAENADSKDFTADGWWRFNEGRDPCRWASGRIFSYGDGTGRKGHFNWHLGIFSERYLKQLFLDAGLSDVRRLQPDEVRGYDHRWINLGVVGTKR